MARNRSRDEKARGRRGEARSRPRRGGPRSAAPEHTRETTALHAEALSWRCPPLRPARKRPTATSLLGQERPMEALRSGLSIRAPGYNLVVAGLMGSGRTTVVKSLIEEIQPRRRPGPDRVYVHDLRATNRPRLLTLPRGTARTFRDEVRDLGDAIHDGLHGALGARPHRVSRRMVTRAGEDRERRIMDALSRQARKLGCEVVRFQAQGGGTSADIYPLHEGEPITLDALGKLAIDGVIPESRRQRLVAARDRLVERLEDVSERLRGLARTTWQELRSMDLRVARRVLEGVFADFRRRWPQQEVAVWLRELQDHIERDLYRWVEPVADEDAPAGDSGEKDGPPPPGDEGPPGPRFDELEVHVVRSDDDAGSVLIETNPTFANLFGSIEPPKDGHYPLSSVHPGSLLRADGGFLIVRAHDLLRDPGVWHQLKRALLHGQVEIREYDQGSGSATGVFQPEPIPIDLKVVLIGEPGLYEHLALEDAQFLHVFKVHAEFDTTVPATRPNLQRYANYLSWLAEHEGLRSVSPEAAAAIAEYGARGAGRRDRLITRYSELADLTREASWLCEQQGQGPVRRAHVDEARRRREHRLDLCRELVEREFSGGSTVVSTSGKAVGQANALTVLDTGALAFGRVCRITANTGAAFASRSGLVNIEGEADLSGPIHDKGVLILEGFLLETFGRSGPLCLQATVCFEQLYNGVEGDSATCAQLLALLSSLSGVPVAQDCAVTASMNQKGDVQSIGGVNEKIESFYRLSRARRLTGRQRVVVPRTNIGELMLEERVCTAVAEGRFHVHAIRHVREAVEIAMDRPYEEVLARAAARLEDFRRLAVE